MLARNATDWRQHGERSRFPWLRCPKVEPSQKHSPAGVTDPGATVSGSVSSRGTGAQPWRSSSSGGPVVRTSLSSLFLERLVVLSRSIARVAVDTTVVAQLQQF